MTIRLKKIPIFGEGIFSRSAVVTRQRRLNVYLEVRKDQDKSSIVAYGTPGLQLAFNASTPLNAPARGLVGNDSALYEVAGNQVLSLSATGLTLQSGMIGTSYGLVGMALNPTQVMIVDGSAGYVFNPTNGAITTVGGSFPNGAQTVTYCNGFFICEDPGTNQFFVSNLNDGTTWTGLSYAAAVQSIDGIAAVDTIGGLLIIFTYGHTEFWQNVGGVPEPFQYIQNSATMYGIEAINSRAHVGDSLMFLAHTNGGSFQNTSGSFQVARIKGYTVQIVSTSDIDNIIQVAARTSKITDATGYSYQIDNHNFYQLNFPSANRSLLYDATTDLWSEVQSGITGGYAARHIGNLSVGAYDQQFIADYSNGNLYNPDPGVYTDNGNTIVRQIVTRCAIEDFNVFRCASIYFDMEVGVGLPTKGVYGYDPHVSISCARDNMNFGAPRLIPLGKSGQDLTRVTARRWGKARQMNFDLTMTDPVKFVVAAGAALISQKTYRGRKAA
jgi:hypothetical protein